MEIHQDPIGRAPAAVFRGRPRPSLEDDDALREALRAQEIEEKMGQGAKHGWGDRPLGVGPESEKWLREKGVFGDWDASHRSFLQRLIRLTILRIKIKNHCSPPLVQ